MFHQIISLCSVNSLCTRRSSCRINCKAAAAALILPHTPRRRRRLDTRVIWEKTSDMKIKTAPEWTQRSSCLCEKLVWAGCRGAVSLRTDAAACRISSTCRHGNHAARKQRGVWVPQTAVKKSVCWVFFLQCFWHFHRSLVRSEGEDVSAAPAGRPSRHHTSHDTQRDLFHKKWCRWIP